MCFGSKANSRTQKSAADAGVIKSDSSKPTREQYTAVANKFDDAYVKASANKKGRIVVNAVDVLGTLIRARREGDDSRVGVVLDELVSDLG